MQLGCANCLVRKVCPDAFQDALLTAAAVAGHRPPPDPYPNPKALPRLPNPAQQQQQQQQGKESGAARRLNRRRRRSRKPTHAHAHARLRVVEAHEEGGEAHPAVRAVRVLSLPPAVAIGFGGSPRQQEPGRKSCPR